MFDESIPEHVDFKASFEHIKIQQVPAMWLKMVHMNSSHPEYWNVVLANISSKYMHIYKEGCWSYIPFKLWAREFVENIFRIYCREISPPDQIGEVYRIMLNDEFPAVLRSLELCLLGPMRRTIKSHHKLR